MKPKKKLDPYEKRLHKKIKLLKKLRDNANTEWFANYLSGEIMGLEDARCAYIKLKKQGKI